MALESIKNATSAYATQGSMQASKAKADVSLDTKNTEDAASLATGSAVTSISGTDTLIDGKRQQASTSQLREAVEKINNSKSGTEAVFGFHEGTNRVTIKIIDKDSKDVIKEFPAEETLDLIEKAWEMAGILVDERR